MTTIARAPAEDVVAALTALITEVTGGAIPFGPQGYAVVPAGLVDTASELWLDGARLARGTETVVARDGALCRLRHPAPASGDREREDRERSRWYTGILGIRLGLSEALLDDCVGYLGARESGEAVLLRRQLVQSSIAEVLIEHLEVRAVLAGPEPLDAATRAHLHEQLTGADRELLRLLGASGFTTEGKGRKARVSELLAAAYQPGRVG
ncbi:hypothetical protein [Sciscionella sediminilitoris]|uniref:hypothetical protein n=1 Tax=Sciscionella sediminilitoris TaxID=1445613 RepID=UPI00056ACCDE|nr:hypothetical protein [Sciscionella sp. SE31]